MHGKYGVLEEMDFTPSRVRSLSPERNKGRISPITHKKSWVILHLFNVIVEVLE
jgi:hypothetical protein